MAAPSIWLHARSLQVVTTPTEPALGTGLILLIIFGVIATLACVLSLGRGPVVRCTVISTSSFCYGILVLILLLLPREPRVPSSSTLAVREDYAIFARILFFVVVSPHWLSQSLAPAPALKLACHVKTH